MANIMVIERQPRPGPRASLILKSIDLREQETNHEILLVPSFDVLTISGPAGTGKTAVADLIATMSLGLDSVKVGQDLRVRLHQETGEQQGAYFMVPVEKDIAVDQWQIDRMKSARKPLPGPRPEDELRWRPILIEGRLSGVVGARVTDEVRGLNSPRIFRVLLTYNPGGDQTGRYDRILPRERDKYPDKTDKEIIEETERRDEEFVEKIQGLEEEGLAPYQNLLRKSHPYDPNITTAEGKRVYNFIIDTQGMTVAEVYNELMKRLLKQNFLRPLRRADFGPGEIGNIAYSFIAQTKPCEAIVQGSDRCERYATRTLDSYAFDPRTKGPATIRISPACSKEHSRLIRKELEKTGHKLGMQLRFGKNGMPLVA